MKYLLFFSFLFAPEMFACSCADISNVKKLFDDADMVFLGKIVEVKEVMEQGKPLRRATFAVERSWKGVTEDKVILHTERHMCGSHFSVGERYLQFGYKDPQKNHVCNGTGVAASAQKTIELLDKSASLK